MPIIKMDLDSIDTFVAWYCQKCGRIEAPKEEKHCPHCGETMQRCSRYEWFLADELCKALQAKKVKFRLVEQWPLPDPRGFTWYWDLFVWVEGSSSTGGYGELIEVNDTFDHGELRRYKDSGNTYTTDSDKKRVAFELYQLRSQGINCRTVTNEECTKVMAPKTAQKIAKDLLSRARSGLSY